MLLPWILSGDLLGVGNSKQFCYDGGMNKNLALLIVLLLIIGTFIFARLYSSKEEKLNTQTDLQSYKNATYIVDGKSITLTDGFSEVEAAPGSASKITTRYFGNEVTHDLNDDGRDDVVFLLTQETGGSGTFFYVVAALNTPTTGYKGSNAFFLGDRIAPQTTEIDEGKTANGTNRKNVIVVNYAVRLPGQSLAEKPSVGKSVWLKLDPATMQFGEVAQNFEGEL